MKSPVLLALLCCAGVAFACGPRTRSSESSAPRATVRHKRAPQTAPLVPRVDVAVEKRVRFSLFVTNESAKKVEVEFPDAKTHDFAVLDSTGTEVWRWSRERIFTSALQTKVIGVDDAHEFADSWDAGGMHGKFTVVATLSSSNFPLEQRAEFHLP